MTIRLAGFEQESYVDGEGIRFVIFTQGCPHHCPGCHNPETHDFNKGKDYDIQDILKMIDSDPLITGITLSGGDPFCQPVPCSVLAKEAHKRGLSVWCYTGFTIEEIMKKPPEGCFNLLMTLLPEIDVLVDGRFELEKRDLDLPFRGSSNQRILDVKKSCELNKAVDYISTL